ncbi:MAG: efflux RND transporter periplasmic adaptor subunit, partial [Planctomycetes bacterium]|nr:efflux RND transporter periplasmic adaptor subunit [Planctomycetota bacterium]
MSNDPILVLGPTEVAPGRRSRWLIGTVIVVVMAAIAGFTLRSGGGPWVEARRGDIVLSLAALGRVEAARVVEMVPRIAARIEAIHVEEGDEVEAGQVLVTLEGALLAAQLDEAERGRDAAKARLDLVERGARPEERERTEAQVEEAVQGVRAADARSAEAERGARPEDVDGAEARLRSARSEAEYAAAEWQRAKGLFEKGVISARERDQAKREADAAEQALRQTQAYRDRVVHGASQEERAELRATCDSAKARLRQAQATRDQLVHGATAEDRRAAEAELKRAEAVVARLRVEMEQTKIVAPFRGIVVRRYREPSELAHPQMVEPILVVADARERLVRLEVLENDIYKVRLGQAATITSEANPGRMWRGTVSRIAPVLGRKRLTAENPKERADVKVMEVWIKPSEPLELPLNVSAEARIEEVLKRNALVLPIEAVDGASCVRMADGSVRRVECGARDDSFVEVVDGVVLGERVRV